MDGYVRGFPEWVREGDSVAAVGSTSRKCLKEKQVGANPLIDPSTSVNNFQGGDFPRGDVLRVVAADIPRKERHVILTYLIGAWFIDNVDGEWCFVPVIVDNPALYLNFHLGVSISVLGQMWDTTASAKNILDGKDVGDIEKNILFIEANVNVINKRRLS